MSILAKYIVEHCTRGACTCGRCIDAPPDAKNLQPDSVGHTVDLQFFKVALKDNPLDVDKEIMKDELIPLIKGHKGDFCDVDLFDGKEHNFIEIGGWIGDQGLALILMGMGELIGIWKVATPNRIAPDFSEETRTMLAQTGYISITFKKDKNLIDKNLIDKNLKKKR